MYEFLIVLYRSFTHAWLPRILYVFIDTVSFAPA